MVNPRWPSLLINCSLYEEASYRSPTPCKIASLQEKLAPWSCLKSTRVKPKAAGSTIDMGCGDKDAGSRELTWLLRDGSLDLEVDPYRLSPPLPFGSGLETEMANWHFFGLNCFCWEAKVTGSGKSNLSSQKVHLSSWAVHSTPNQWLTAGDDDGWALPSCFPCTDFGFFIAKRIASSWVVSEVSPMPLTFYNYFISLSHFPHCRHKDEDKICADLGPLKKRPIAFSNEIFCSAL